MWTIHWRWWWRCPYIFIKYTYFDFFLNSQSDYILYLHTVVILQSFIILIDWRGNVYKILESKIYKNYSCIETNLNVSRICLNLTLITIWCPQKGESNISSDFYLPSSIFRKRKSIYYKKKRKPWSKAEWQINVTTWESALPPEIASW